MAGADLAVVLRAIDELSGPLRTAANDVRGFQRHLDDVGRTATRAGATLSAGLTLPILGIGAAAATAAANFDESMTKLVSLVGISREDMQGLRKDVLAMAGEIGRPPQELADALFFVESAGFRGAEALDVLRASAMAADAGLGDTKGIADAVTSAVNAYGIENLSAAQATATLVAAVREGKMPPEALAGALGRVLPIASQLGVSFDQVGAAIASMTRLGLNADEAATALRGTMAALIKPTADAEKALAGIGLSSAGLRAQLREQGLLATLQTLQERFGENETAMARVFPNIRALTGVLNLLGSNSDEAAQIFANLAAVTEDDLTNAFNAAQGVGLDPFQDAQAKLQVGLIELGTVLMPSVIAVVDRLSGALQGVTDWFGRLSPEMRTAILIGAGLLAVVGPLLLGFGMLATSLAALLPIMALLLGPVGLVILAIAAITTAVLILWNNNDDFRAAVEIAWAAISEAIGTAAAFIGEEVLPRIVAAIQQLWEHTEGLRDFLAAAWVFIRLAVVIAAEKIADQVIGLIDSFRELWEATEGLRDLVVAAFQFMKDRAGELMETMGNSIIGGLVDAIRTGVSRVVRAVRGLLDDALAAAKAKLQIGSPSHVFFELGQSISEGLAAGILDQEDEVEAAVGDIVAVVKHGWAATLPFAGFLAGSEAGAGVAAGILDQEDEVEAAVADIVQVVRHGWAAALSFAGFLARTAAGAGVAAGLTLGFHPGPGGVPVAAAPTPGGIPTTPYPKPPTGGNIIDWVPSGGGWLPVFGSSGPIRPVSEFQAGGWVPGAIGAPLLAIVHGGERVIPAGAAGGGGNIIIQGDVYGFDDFERKVAEAHARHTRRGGF